jgi:hypothetical protein
VHQKVTLALRVTETVKPCEGIQLKSGDNFSLKRVVHGEAGFEDNCTGECPFLEPPLPHTLFQQIIHIKSDPPAAANFAFLLKDIRTR